MFIHIRKHNISHLVLESRIERHIFFVIFSRCDLMLSLLITSTLIAINSLLERNGPEMRITHITASTPQPRWVHYAWNKQRFNWNYISAAILHPRVIFYQAPLVHPRDDKPLVMGQLLFIKGGRCGLREKPWLQFWGPPYQCNVQFHDSHHRCCQISPRIVLIH